MNSSNMYFLVAIINNDHRYLPCSSCWFTGGAQIKHTHNHVFAPKHHSWSLFRRKPQVVMGIYCPSQLPNCPSPQTPLTLRHDCCWQDALANTLPDKMKYSWLFSGDFREHEVLRKKKQAIYTWQSNDMSHRFAYSFFRSSTVEETNKIIQQKHPTKCRIMS